jgi:hypothetical protein|tara:strand:+ start:918 stop:1235 length:318 start_codon:yes stop_codon:yes gene_type:complete
MANITHKRGDTLEWVVALTQDGAVVDITGWTISSQIRQDTTLIDNLTVIIVNAANGEFNLTATTTQTASWTLGSHSIDIEFIDTSAFVVSSQTFTLQLVRDITYV